MVNVLPNYVQSQNARDESALINHLKFWGFFLSYQLGGVGKRRPKTCNNEQHYKEGKSESLRVGPRYVSSQPSAVYLGLGALPESILFRFND